MGRRCPFLEPQGDESSEEWRRPGEKRRKQEGREERAQWGERREEKTLGGQHRPRAGDWVKVKRKSEAAWEMGRPLPTCPPLKARWILAAPDSPCVPDLDLSWPPI